MTLDPARPTLKARLARGECVGASWFTLGDPTLVELTFRGALRPDAAVIDMQHGLFDRHGLEAAMGALPSGTPGLVRTRDDRPASIGEALDAGAEGVLVPLVETGAQAEAAAHACRYPPDGHRSGGGVRPLGDFAAHVEHANAAIVAGVMIETRAGVDAAAEIATSGVDIVFIGTGDLALSLGTAPGGEAHAAACAAVLEACNQAGVPCGIFAMDATGAVRRREQGYALTVVAIDMVLFEDGLNRALGDWTVTT